MNFNNYDDYKNKTKNISNEISLHVRELVNYDFRDFLFKKQFKREVPSKVNYLKESFNLVFNSIFLENYFRNINRNQFEMIMQYKNIANNCFLSKKMENVVVFSTTKIDKNDSEITEFVNKIIDNWKVNLMFRHSKFFDNQWFVKNIKNKISKEEFILNFKKKTPFKEELIHKVNDHIINLDNFKLKNEYAKFNKEFVDMSLEKYFYTFSEVHNLELKDNIERVISGINENTLIIFYDNNKVEHSAEKYAFYNEKLIFEKLIATQNTAVITISKKENFKYTLLELLSLGNLHELSEILDFGGWKSISDNIENYDFTKTLLLDKVDGTMSFANAPTIEECEPPIMTNIYDGIDLGYSNKNYENQNFDFVNQKLEYQNKLEDTVKEPLEIISNDLNSEEITKTLLELTGKENTQETKTKKLKFGRTRTKVLDGTTSTIETTKTKTKLAKTKKIDNTVTSVNNIYENSKNITNDFFKTQDINLNTDLTFDTTTNDNLNVKNEIKNLNLNNTNTIETTNTNTITKVITKTIDQNLTNDLITSTVDNNFEKPEASQLIRNTSNINNTSTNTITKTIRHFSNSMLDEFKEFKRQYYSFVFDTSIDLKKYNKNNYQNFVTTLSQAEDNELFEFVVGSKNAIFTKLSNKNTEEDYFLKMYAVVLEIDNRIE